MMSKNTDCKTSMSMNLTRSQRRLNLMNMWLISIITMTLKVLRTRSVLRKDLGASVSSNQHLRTRASQLIKVAVSVVVVATSRMSHSVPMAKRKIAILRQEMSRLMTKMKALNINPERTSNMIRTLRTIMITLMVKKMRMKKLNALIVIMVKEKIMIA